MYLCVYIHTYTCFPQPYRGIYYACLTTGIALFANACRLCSCRPTDGRSHFEFFLDLINAIL